MIWTGIKQTAWQCGSSSMVSSSGSISVNVRPTPGPGRWSLDFTETSPFHTHSIKIIVFMPQKGRSACQDELTTSASLHLPSLVSLTLKSTVTPRGRPKGLWRPHLFSNRLAVPFPWGPFSFCYLFGERLPHERHGVFEKTLGISITFQSSSACRY